MSTAPQGERSHTPKVPRVAPAISKWAPRRSESDLTGPECQDSCASDLKMSTAAQREPSNTHKVTNGCASDLKMRTAPQRERSNTHHNRRVVRVARAYVRFSQSTAPTTKKEHWKSKEKSKTTMYVGLSNFFVEVLYKGLHLPRKMSPSHPKSCTCHAELSSCSKSNSTTVSRNDIFDPFKRCPSSSYITPATKNDLQKHL